jgi:cytochrome c-type biogenesis protein CcmE
MLTKKVKSRIVFLFFIFTISIIAIVFILKSLNQNILYFSTPTEIKQKEDITIGKPMRVGGMVKKNSIIINKNSIQFIVTDLFDEGKGVVAEGKLKDKNFFIASRILAKHDEKYMPPEIKEILKNNAK